MVSEEETQEEIQEDQEAQEDQGDQEAQEELEFLAGVFVDRESGMFEVLRGNENVTPFAVLAGALEHYAGRVFGVNIPVAQEENFETYLAGVYRNPATGQLHVTSADGVEAPASTLAGAVGNFVGQLGQLLPPPQAPSAKSKPKVLRASGPLPKVRRRK